MIPDEAVEAAASYMDGALEYISSPADMRAAIREALEAAAPHMINGGWVIRARTTDAV